MLKKTRRFIFKRTLKKQLIKHLKEFQLLGTSDMDLKVEYENFLGVDFSFLTKDSDKRLFDEVYLYDDSEEQFFVIMIKGKEIVEKIVFSISKWFTLIPKEYIIIKPTNNLPLVQTINFESGEIILKQTLSESLDLGLKEALHELKVTLDEVMDNAVYGLYELNIKRLVIESQSDCCKHFIITQELSKPILKPESDISFKKFHNLKRLF